MFYTYLNMPHLCEAQCNF